MSNLQHRQTKIQKKRKQTLWRDFVMEICSWKSLMFYKHQSGLMSPIPPLDVKVSTSADYYEGISHLENPGIGGDFIDKLHELLVKNGLVNTVNIQSENSQYADIVVTSSNVYLSSTVVNDCKNILYSLSVKDGSIGVYNSLMAGGSSQNIYFFKSYY